MKKGKRWDHSLHLTFIPHLIVCAYFPGFIVTTNGTPHQAPNPRVLKQEEILVSLAIVLVPSEAHHHNMFIPDLSLQIRSTHTDAVSTETE